MRKDDHGSFIYVTDYTSHPGLEALSVDEPWARGLKGKIVKVFLQEAQKDMAESAVVGSFYCLRKMRLKMSPLEGCLVCTLGGTEKLVIAVNPNNPGNSNLNGLLRCVWMRVMGDFLLLVYRRQEDWRRRKASEVLPTSSKTTKPSPRRVTTPSPLNTNIVKKTGSGPITRIKDISSSERGRKQYSIWARAVDFHPFDLRDAFFQICTSCKVE